MTDKIIKFLKFIWPAAVFCLVLFAFLNIAYAQDSLGGWAKYLQPILPSFNALTGATGEDIAASVIRRGITLVKYLVGAGALIMGLIYGMNFVFARGKEDVITKYRQNFLWLFIGFVIIMTAENIANIFNPEEAKANALIDFKAANDQIRQVTNYIKWLIGSVIVLFITVSGVRLVLARGNQEKITKQKNHLIYSGIGMLVLLLATNIVNAIYVFGNPDEIVAANSTVAITELGSIIRLLLVFLGPVTIIFTISAGFMYLTAFENEDRAKKARKMITAGVTGIVLVYMAYALVNTFMTAPLTPATTTVTP